MARISRVHLRFDCFCPESRIQNPDRERLVRGGVRSEERTETGRSRYHEPFLSQILTDFIFLFFIKQTRLSRWLG